MGTTAHSQVLPPNTALQIIRAAVEASQEAVVITDAQLDKPGPHILFVNPAFTRMTGYTAEEAIGKSPRILQGPKSDRSVLDSLKESLRAGTPVSGEIINYRKDGSEFVLQWRIVPVRDSDGQLTHYFSVQQDVTEQRRKDDELRQLTASLEKHATELVMAHQQMENFVHSIAHDLRSPIRSIRGLADVLLEDHGAQLGSEAQRLLQSIAKSSVKLANMLDGLLEFSKLGYGNFDLKPVNIDVALEEAIELLTDEIVRSCATVERTSTSVWVKAHASTLILVFGNLISNAIRHSKPGHTPMIRISAESKVETVRVSVSDNGQGIPRENHERIFELFTRMSSDDNSTGAGVGLALVKAGVERMGGRVGVQSEVGRGSCFWLELVRAHCD